MATLTKVIITKEQVDSCFECDEQHEAMINLWHLDPDYDAKLETCVNQNLMRDYGRVGLALSSYLWLKAIEFDQEHHPDVFAGGLYMQYGFSEDKNLDPWEIVYPEVIYTSD